MRVTAIIKQVIGPVLIRWLSSTTFSASKVSVLSTGAILIKAANNGRLKIRLKHIGSSGQVYLGDSTVTVADGYRIEAGTEWIEDRTTGAIYGIASSGTIDVRVIEYE